MYQKFCIVTPTFNHAQFIESAVNSVLSNSYKNYEYIVMDGGSTDNTLEKLNPYKDKINKIISEKDGGQADAINKGFKLASADCEIYAYLNSDDLLFPDALEKVAKFFYENPEIDVLYGDAVYVDENLNFLRYFHSVEEFNLYRLSTCSDFINQPATFWRKKVNQHLGGFSAHLFYGFDWEFWIRAAKAGFKFHHMSHPLGVNREHSKTKTMSGSFDRLSELFEIVNHHKSGYIPHAIFGYTLGSVFADLPAGPMKDYFVRIFHFLNAKNTRYYQKNIVPRSLYGTKMLNSRVDAVSCFHMPALTPTKELRFNVHFSEKPEEDVELEVLINDSLRKKVLFKKIDPNNLLKIDLIESDLAKKKVVAQLKFNSHSGNIYGPSVSNIQMYPESHSAVSLKKLGAYLTTKTGLGRFSAILRRYWLRIMMWKWGYGAIIFDRTLPALLKEYPSFFRERILRNMTVEIKVIGRERRNWLVSFDSSGRPKLNSNDCPTVSIVFADETLKGLVYGHLSVRDAFLNGVVTVNGEAAQGVTAATFIEKLIKLLQDRI